MKTKGFSPRKTRSHELLLNWKIPINLELPEIETETTSNRRNSQDVAERAMALGKVYLRSQNASFSDLDPGFADSDMRFLTKLEVDSIQRMKSRKVQIQATWSIESLWILLWALRFVDALERPTKLCDVNQAIGIIRLRGMNRFLNESFPREQSEILDECDLMYRCHWAVVEAEFRGKELKLIPGVIQERHRALNWLVQDVDWDDVSLDT